MRGKLRHAWIAMHRIPGSYVIGVLYVGFWAVIWIWTTLYRGGLWFRWFFAIAVAGGAVVAALLQSRQKASNGRLTELRDGRAPDFNRWHPGLIFVLGITAAVLIRAPEMWWFFAGAIGGGVVIAIVLQRMTGRSAPPRVT